MADHSPPESMREWLDMIVEACSSIPDRTADELYAEVQEAGVDVTRLLSGVQATLDSAQAASRQAMFAEAAHERRLALAQLAAIEPNYASRDQREGQLRYLVERTGATAYFRDLKDLSDEDISQMITELEYLHRKQNE